MDAHARSTTSIPTTPAPAAKQLRLNLGCGDASVAGFVNVDRFPMPNVDQQVDLALAWPWADSSVAEIRAWDVIEHLPDKIHTMNEMWRVLCPGGQAEIVVPTTDGSGAFQDPTHVAFWNRRSFLYYEAGNPYRERFAASYGIAAAFRVVREAVAQTIDGPKLTIVLEAMKLPASEPAEPAPAGTGERPYDVVILSAVATNLVACVQAIRANQPGLDPSHIIVVDDGARAQAEHALPGVRWIEGAKPFVFARNANLGVAASTRDVILLNDDALLTTPGGLDALARAGRRAPADGEARPGAVSAAVFGLIGNPNQSPRPGHGVRREEQMLCFVCVYLPRATLDAVGAFDTRFVGYGYDDNDFCDRIRAAGLGLAVCDGCVVDHSGRLPSSFRSRADHSALLALNHRLYRDKQTGAAGPNLVTQTVLGAMRVKNEAAHIGEVLASMLPLCDRVLVFDDHSDDGTPSICASFGPRVELIPSPFTGLDESRDKNYLLSRIGAQDPDWVLWIDGDEVLERAGPDRLRALITQPEPAVYGLQVAYLWDDPLQVRTDGIFGWFVRPSLFRLRGQPRHQLTFPQTGPGNLHCGNVPRGIQGGVRTAPVRLKHYGYLTRDLRERKYEWYNRIDPGSVENDQYRHLVEIPGARHAPGPPMLSPWHE